MAAARARKELGATAGGQPSRDFTGLVRKVKDILPQYSDDVVCEALIQTDEDVMRAVDLLLSSAFATRSGKKKEKKREEHEQAALVQAAAEVPPEGDWAEEVQEYIQEPVKEERPKSENEKQVAKLKKKLREIKSIEERLAHGEKVDPLQLPKLKNKSELEYEILVCERKIRQEETIRDEERRQLEAERKIQDALSAEIEWKRRAEEEAASRRQQQEDREAARLAQEQAASRQREQAQAEREAARTRQVQQSQQQAQQWQAPQVQSPVLQPVQPVQFQTKSAELLNMLHGAKQESASYEQSRQMAQQLSGGRGPVLAGPGQTQVAPSHGKGSPPQYRPQKEAYQQDYHQPRRNDYQQQQQRGYQQQWSSEKEEDPAEKSARVARISDLYSTPLDLSSIPANKRAEADRIAKEIEGTGIGGTGTGGAPRAERRPRTSDKGGGKGGYERNNEGKGKGKGKGKWKQQYAAEQW